MKKRGISLVVLVLTVIVLGILATTVTVTVANSLSNAKLVTFSQDLSTVQAAIETYMVEKGVLPYEGSSINASNLASLAGSNSSTLMSEINENGDENSLFYVVNLSKIGITESSRGLKANGEVDVYYVNGRGTKVYYPIGVSVRGTRYFSLTNRLAGLTTVKQEGSASLGTGITIVGSEGAIILTKNLNTWTNSLVVSVYTTLDSGESVRYSVGDLASESIVDTDMKINIVEDLTASEIEELSVNKVISVKKYSSSNILIAQANINVGNFDYIPPEIATPNVVIGTDFNLVSFETLIDEESGIKELKYIWTERIDDNGETITNENEITIDYILNNGASAEQMIQLASNISQIQVVAVDYAGNVSEDVVIVDIDVVLAINARTLPSMASEMYGKIVTNYTVENSTLRTYLNIAGVEWKLLHSDGDNAYLIASTYIPVGSSLATVDTSYSALPYAPNGGYPHADSHFWRGASFTSKLLSSYAGSASIASEKLQKLNSKYYEYLTTNNKTSTNNNMKAVAYMLDTNIWSGYANSDYAEFAIGGPTIELILDSYNLNYKEPDKHGYGIDADNKEYWVDDISGYKIKGDAEDEADGFVNLKYDDTGLYWEWSDSTYASGYWIASPLYGTDYYMALENGVPKAMAASSVGFRPVICLKSDVEFEHLGGDNLIIK